MTNETIILNAQLNLLDQGKIKSTGRMIEVQRPNGETEIVPEPEAIHTFLFWRQNGFKVKKGEHAVAKIRIWKAGKSTTEIQGQTPDGDPATLTEESLRMFMKEAHFFSASQVEPSARATA